MSDVLHFDIETIPSGERIPLDEIPNDSRIKDPEKQKARKLKKQEEEYEKQGLNPLKAQVLCFAAIHNEDTPVFAMDKKDERVVLEKLENYIIKEFGEEEDGEIFLRPFTWSGANIKSFDLQIVSLRAIKYELPVLAKSIDRNFFNSNVFDLCEFFKSLDRHGKGYTQDAIAEFLGIETPEELVGMDGSQVYELYKLGEFKKIQQYNIGDVKKVKAIYDKVKKIVSI